MTFDASTSVHVYRGCVAHGDSFHACAVNMSLDGNGVERTVELVVLNRTMFDPFRVGLHIARTGGVAPGY